MASRPTSLIGSLCSLNPGTNVWWWMAGQAPQVSTLVCRKARCLAPLLFLLHINNLPSIVGSQLSLFIRRRLPHAPPGPLGVDQEHFPKDLAALEGWGDPPNKITLGERS